MKFCVKLKLHSHMYLQYEPQAKMFLKLHLKEDKFVEAQTLCWFV